MEQTHLKPINARGRSAGRKKSKSLPTLSCDDYYTFSFPVTPDQARPAATHADEKKKRAVA